MRTAADSELVATELPKSTKVGDSASETGACTGGIFEVESASTSVGDSELLGGGCTPEDPPPTAFFSLDVEKSLSSGRRGFLRTIECCGPCAEPRQLPSGTGVLWGAGLSDRQRQKVYNDTSIETSEIWLGEPSMTRYWPSRVWCTQGTGRTSPYMRAGPKNTRPKRKLSTDSAKERILAVRRSCCECRVSSLLQLHPRRASQEQTANQ